MTRKEKRTDGSVPEGMGKWRNSVEKKRTIWHAVICVGLLCLIWGGYFLGKYKIDDSKYRQISLFEDDYSWVYQVDTIVQEEKKVVIQGFAFELGVDATKDKYEIVLHDIKSEENYFMKMEYMNRVDVNSYFMCEYNYLLSGFKASIKSKKLDFEKNEYEVLLRVLGEKTAYRTGTYIVNGRVEYVNPLEYTPLDVEGTKLEKIVEEGYLRVYRPDYGMYVYQYDGELYWIAEDDYEFVDENAYVQYHLDTTQVDKLPQDRVENKWDNRGFEFKTNEVAEWSSEDFRVARVTIPDSYSITKIWTGNHKGDWIWKQEFRPYYKFEE